MYMQWCPALKNALFSYLSTNPEKQSECECIQTFAHTGFQQQQQQKSSELSVNEIASFFLFYYKCLPSLVKKKNQIIQNLID